jgi:hypothetical protein
VERRAPSILVLVRSSHERSNRASRLDDSTTR